MTMNKVRIEVREYPDDAGGYQTLAVRSHWNHDDRCVLEIGEVGGTFLVADLRRALDAVEAGRR